MTTFERVLAKRNDLHRLKQTMVSGGLDGLDHAQRIDVTYTSNALEGNTLTAGETALVLEKGMTIGGKPLKDHLEAIDHARAFDWIMEVARDAQRAITEADIRTLHNLVVSQSNPDIAGRYADRVRYVNTDEGVRHFPSPAAIPALMQDFCRWLEGAGDTPTTAFEAHRRLVLIHPFNDGNGRTARLLMNLILLRGEYPAIAIRPEDRPAYIGALEEVQRNEGHDAFDRLLYARLGQTLDRYLDAAKEAQRR